MKIIPDSWGDAASAAINPIGYVGGKAGIPNPINAITKKAVDSKTGGGSGGDSGGLLAPVTDALGITKPFQADPNLAQDRGSLRQMSGDFNAQRGLSHPGTTQVAEGQAPGQAPVGGTPGYDDRHGSRPAYTPFGKDSTSYVDPTARDAQLNALQLQQQAATGNAPSVAQNMLTSATDTNMRNQLGLAATLQGSNPGMAARQGLAGAADAGAQANAQMAALRAGEMATARDAYGGLAGQARQQNIGVANANADRDLQGRAIGNSYDLGLGGLQLDAMRGATGVDTGQATARATNDAANQATMGKLFQSGASAAMAGSDRRLKHDIQPGGHAADSFLAGLHNPKTYDYNDPSAPGQYPGKQLGVIAQDMNSGAITGPDGKKYISGDIISRVLAGLGRVDEKVDALKGRRA